MSKRMNRERNIETYKITYTDSDKSNKKLLYKNRYKLSKKEIKRFLLDNLDIEKVVRITVTDEDRNRHSRI